MSLLSRMRADLAVGVLTVGALLFLYRRDIGALVRSSGEKKRKRESSIEAGALKALVPLMDDPSNLDITERILQHCDPQTVMRLASTSKHLNEIVTSSLDLQLRLRNYYHKIPPLIRPSPEQLESFQSSSKREQLDRIIDREERLSRFRHTKLQRCEMPYIDILCSGEYLLVTRSLHGRFRVPDDPHSGPVEDGFTLMLPEKGRILEQGKVGLDGYRDWTVDVGQELADIGARSDENLIAVAVFPNEWDRNPLPATTGEDRPKTRTLRVSFYYLDQDEPHPTDPDRSLLVPHAEAKYPVVDFEFDATESRAVRLRLGTDGRLAIWLKQHGASPNSRAFIYDWRKGLGLGTLWVTDDHSHGHAQDFTFSTPDIILGAVLTPTNPSRQDGTPNTEDEEGETRLEIQVLRLPPPAAAVQVPDNDDRNHDEPIIVRPQTFPRCIHVASLRLPKFTYKWHNPGPSPDEVLPVEGGQTFHLVHCSMAAKSSPGNNASGEDQGLLCLTLEGDFGPVTHPEPQGVAHDHGVIAFCTIAGSVLGLTYNDQPVRGQAKILEYDAWHKGHVSWDFGPACTWITGYGTRTTSVSRFVGIQTPLDQEMPDPENDKRSTVVNVRMRNYDPVAVNRAGRISRHPLGRPAIKSGTDAENEKDSADTGLLSDAERAALPAPPLPDELMRIVETTRAQLEAIQQQQGGPLLPLPPGVAPNHGLPDFSDLFGDLDSPTPGDSFQVVKASRTVLREMFSGTELVSSLPYYEANVSIPLDDEGDPRDDAASEHPFKTILARDKLIVCDDAGFDILYF